MTIQIKDQTKSDRLDCYDLTCGNKSAYVSHHKNHSMICVCVQNAAHKAWRGSGRTFGTFADALAAYKSPEVKAMIAFVESDSLVIAE